MSQREAYFAAVQRPDTTMGGRREGIGMFMGEMVFSGARWCYERMKGEPKGGPAPAEGLDASVASAYEKTVKR
ncbi:TPA: hypothetical protein HA265_04145 [Candidatus Woesearchaeota archaeon]|nr:hypothetical protein [Candidatus Woesearchaeota archaeon]